MNEIVNEITVSRPPESIEAEVATEAACHERHRAFLKTCMKAYLEAYTNYFPPVSEYHKWYLEMYRQYRALPPAQEN